jgi:L-lactate dehydrogenase complex protein LldE
MPKPPKVQLFHTCIINEIYPEVGLAVVNVLERLGIAVEVPLEQTCCGQPAFNGGFHADARKVARLTVDILSATEGPVIVPSGSCGDMLTHQYAMLFDDDPAYLEKARVLSGRCYEFSMFLVDVLGIDDLGALWGARAPSGRDGFPGPVSGKRIKAAYHPSCHLLRGLGGRTQPEALLARIGGLERAEVKDQEECCGFGGMFAVKNAAISGSMLENKLRNLEASGADTVVSCDMGCLMHLHGGMHRQGSRLAVKHIAQVLDEGMA